ncbi:MAG: hypothetical protein MJE66_06475 [Proteobacteria bacterium]|nr:hypothetical protein [Pseudomonadota bacterium]
MKQLLALALLVFAIPALGLNGCDEPPGTFEVEQVMETTPDGETVVKYLIFDTRNGVSIFITQEELDSILSAHDLKDLFERMGKKDPGQAQP